MCSICLQPWSEEQAERGWWAPSGKREEPDFKDLVGRRGRRRRPAPKSSAEKRRKLPDSESDTSAVMNPYKDYDHPVLAAERESDVYYSESSSDESMAGRDRGRKSAASGSRGSNLKRGPLLMAAASALLPVAKGAQFPPPTPTMVVSMLAVLGLVCRRSLQAFDTVITAVEVVTVDVVEAVGQETTRAVPVLAGVLLTLILVITRSFVQRLWWDHKEHSKDCGESPEGNAASSTDVVAVPPGRARPTSCPLNLHPWPFPEIPWLTPDLLRTKISNMEDAVFLAKHQEGNEVKFVQRLLDSLMTVNFRVQGQAHAKTYTVRMHHHAKQMLSEPLPKLRSLISCGCPGYQQALSDPDRDRVCKHCGAVLLCCWQTSPLHRVGSGIGPFITSFPPNKYDLMLANDQGRPATELQSTMPHSASAIESQSSMPRSSAQVPLKSGAQTTRTWLCPSGVAASNSSESEARPIAKPRDVTKTKALDLPMYLHHKDDFGNYDSGAEEASEILRDGGTFKSIMSAKETQKMALFLLQNAKHRADLTAFSVDLLVLCNALAEATSRGVIVSVYVDRRHSYNGTTEAQMQRLSELRSKGIEVFLTDGAVSSGIQHSKCLLADDYFIVGSTNWTSNARSNHEVSVLLELNLTGKEAVNRKLSFIKKKSQLLTQDLISSSTSLRSEKRVAQLRSKSVDPDQREQYATAKRFSLARARSQQKRYEAAVADQRPTE